MSGTWQSTRHVETPATPSRAAEFNDGTLEIAIALWRLLALLSVPAWTVAMIAGLITLDPRWCLALVALTATGALWWWLGFWVFGNDDWRREPKPARPEREWGA